MAVLKTRISGLALDKLIPGHAAALYNLLQDNRRHLTAHGDYLDQVATTYKMIEVELANRALDGLRFGIFLEENLIGRMDIVPVDPPRYGLGYWLAESATGKGYARAALESLIAHAAGKLGATDIYAGVTHGNQRSEALLQRLGFLPVTDFETYTRFHLSTQTPAGSAPASR